MDLMDAKIGSSLADTDFAFSGLYQPPICSHLVSLYFSQSKVKDDIQRSASHHVSCITPPHDSVDIKHNNSHSRACLMNMANC